MTAPEPLLYDLRGLPSMRALYAQMVPQSQIDGQTEWVDRKDSTTVVRPNEWARVQPAWEQALNQWYTQRGLTNVNDPQTQLMREIARLQAQDAAWRQLEGGEAHRRQLVDYGWEPQYLAAVNQWNDTYGATAGYVPGFERYYNDADPTQSFDWVDWLAPRTAFTGWNADGTPNYDQGPLRDVLTDWGTGRGLNLDAARFDAAGNLIDPSISNQALFLGESPENAIRLSAARTIESQSADQDTVNQSNLALLGFLGNQEQVNAALYGATPPDPDPEPEPPVVPTTSTERGMDAYNSFLMAEMLGILSNPDWASVPANVTRMNQIRQEQERAAASQNRIPVLDSNGNPVLDAQGQPVYQSMQSAMQNLYTQTEQARLRAIQENEARYNQLLQGYGDRLNTAMNEYFLPAANRFSDVATQLHASLASASQGYRDRQTAGLELLDSLGDRARTDLSQRYQQARGSADNDLVGRGLGNTTVRNSVMTGIGSQENQDFQRLEEGLRREQLGYSTQLSGDWLNSLVNAATQNSAAQTQAANYFNTLGANYAQLSADPFGVMERRTDTAPGLSDVTNLAMQFGRGADTMFALPGFQSQFSFQQPR